MRRLRILRAPVFAAAMASAVAGLPLAFAIDPRLSHAAMIRSGDPPGTRS